MLKGKTVIELTDVNTGQKEVYEDTNLVTEAAFDILNVNIDGMLYDNTSFNGSNGEDWLLPIKKTSWAVFFYTRMRSRSVRIIFMLR